MATYTGWKAALTAALGEVGKRTRVKRFNLTGNLVVDPSAWPTDHVVTTIYTQPTSGGPYSVTHAGVALPIAKAGETAVRWTYDGADWVPSDTRSGTDLALPSSPGGGDLYDSTSRLVLESYQRPETGPYGESIRLHAKTPQAKTMMTWYTPTNPMNPKADAWIGSHYAGQVDGTGVHGHISIETPMANGSLHSRFGIDWIDQTTKTRGTDISHTYVANSHFTHRQGDGAVFSISSGPGSDERKIEFSAQTTPAGEPPGIREPMKRRWWLVVDQAVESGGNAGSNFLIRRFNDDGSAGGTTLYIDRAKGNVTLGEASAQWAALTARGPGGSNHSFQSTPKASLDAGFAHYAAASFSASTERLIDGKVTGDANSRVTVDVAGKIEWGDGTLGRDVSLYRAAANTLETPNRLSVGARLIMGSTTDGFVEVREQTTAPATPGTDRVRLYARDDGAGKSQIVALFPTGTPVVIATEA